jgi:flagellar basal-body rod modification protein FlgD
MTAITSAYGAGANVRQTSSDAAKAKLDYDSFLRLFVASMKNQDPTKPNDPAQSLAQLASFSTVEQSIKLNEKLDSLVTSSAASLAASLVGKSVSSMDGAVSGTVSRVENDGAGLVAVLESGGRVPLSGGYMVGAT